MGADPAVIAPVDGATKVVRQAAQIRANGPCVLAFVAGFLVPLKAARVDVAGLSLYLAYIAVFVAATRWWRTSLSWFRDWFVGPLAVIGLWATWAVASGAGLNGPITTVLKFLVAFGTVVGFAILLGRAERWLHRGLFAGLVVSVAYMAYQWLSGTLFGFRLPFSSIARLKIGFGLSERYGLVRVTGFTEEPSFIATILVGTTLLLVAHAVRTHRGAMLRASVLVGGIGLAMCTSNNLFATAIIVAAFWPFVRNRRIVAMLVSYYVVALVVTPLVLLRDITYYSRFSAYDIFRRSGPLDMLVGHGVGAYPRFFSLDPIRFQGQDVASLASLWGGILFEGGIVLVALAIWWLARIVRRTGWREAVALIALLLMLSNYNSPWWPLVCLALAECMVHRRKEPEWTTRSISPSTSTPYGAGGWSSSSLPSSARWPAATTAPARPTP